MKIADGVAMIVLDIQGFVLHPTVVWDEDAAVLIDTGMPGHFEKIRSALEKDDVPLRNLKSVILTHQDLDHIGGMPEMLTYSQHPIEVYAHPLDQPYIEGIHPLIKTNRDNMSEEEWNALPDPMKALYLNPPTSNVHHTIEDGQQLPFPGGIEVIHTQGHTPGHISLYLKESKTLIAGDAMICSDGKLKGPVERTTPDMDTALNSIEKLLDYDIDKVICYHGGLCTENVKRQLRDLVKSELYR